jgi:4-coumarate--CoA ligase
MLSPPPCSHSSSLPFSTATSLSYTPFLLHLTNDDANDTHSYWKNPKATAETLTPDKWLRTGDITYVDSNGHFFIVDRRKELIKVKANQVAPAELEALLLEHEDIADAAVIGIPTPDGDEAPMAFVVRQGTEKAGKLTKEEVQDFVKGKVVRYKQLTGGVQWLDAIPKNPSGKILRRQLREDWKKQSQARL